MNVIIVGSGSYVSGKNTSAFGTILPSVIEGIREGIVRKITIVSKHSSSLSEVRTKINNLEKSTKVKVDYEWFPKKGTDDTAYKKVIENQNDNTVVIVAVPDHLHYDVIKTALNTGKHILVVKPLTPTINEAKSLINLARKKNLHAVVDFHKRYDCTNLKIKEIIKTKKIGELQYVHVEYSQRRIMPEIIFKSWAEKTNIFQYLAVHYIDIIYFVTGARPIRALALGQKEYLLRRRGLDTYDSIQSIIEWDNGGNKFTSTILCNWIDPNTTSAVSYQQIKFVGSNGRIESDQKNRGLQVITEKSGIEEINPYFNQTYSIGDISYFKGYGIDSVVQFLKDCQLIFEGQETPKSFHIIRPTFKNSFISVAVIEAINKSLKDNGRWIYLNKDLIGNMRENNIIGVKK